MLHFQPRFSSRHDLMKTDLYLSLVVRKLIKNAGCLTGTRVAAHGHGYDELPDLSVIVVQAVL